MLAFSDFRDIQEPLRVTHTASAERHGELFAAFARSETVTFCAEVDRAFLTSSLSLRFYADDDGRVLSFPFCRTESISPAYDRFTLTLPLSDLCGEAKDGLFFYHVEAETVYGRLWSHGRDGEVSAWFHDKLAFADAYQLTVYQDGFKTPEYLGQGVMYQIFVDRFFRGGDAPPREDAIMAESWDAEISQFPAYPGAPVANNLFYGGDLDGVRLKLPYLRSLGVSVLYLCPIFEAASNHKYDTGDYRRVDAMFGGREALDRLVSAAEECGVRVILDGVFNHTGSDSRYFNRYGHYEDLGAYQSKDSPYYGWYNFFSWPNEYNCWWGVTILPTVNSSNPAFIDFVAGEDGVAALYAKAGISGLRLDVVDELDPTLVRALRTRLKAQNPDTALIGEVWEDASNKIAYDRRRRYFRGQELDSVMNYPLKNAIISYVLGGAAEEFARASRELYAHYPRPVSEALMNLLGTHDTVRILTVLSGRSLDGLSYAEMRDVRLTAAERNLASARLRLAYAILYFMPGIPCVYYGDEAGMEGAKDPFNRRTYPWGREDEEQIAFFRSLGKMRTENADVLTHGYYKPVVAKDGLLVLSRFTEDKQILLVLNRTDTEIRYPLDRCYTDLLSGNEVYRELSLGAMDFCILASK